jgi:hypothetical protein
MLRLPQPCLFSRQSLAQVVRPVRQKVTDAKTPQAREDYFLVPSRPAAAKPPEIDPALLWKHDLALEHAFAAAGGLLLSGPDPTGRGDVLSGFGDQRGLDLLVEAGLSPVEAIKIATLNGAIYLGRDKQIGSVAVGKNADLIVIMGDPSKQISDVEKVRDRLQGRGRLRFSTAGFSPRKIQAVLSRFRGC